MEWKPGDEGYIATPIGATLTCVVKTQIEELGAEVRLTTARGDHIAHFIAIAPPGVPIQDEAKELAQAVYYSWKRGQNV